MKTRFKTRAFIVCFIPFAALLATSFWTVQRFVQSTIRDGLQTSLRESQLAIANIHAKSDLQNSRFLKVAGENSALKAGVELLLEHPQNDSARRTVEDQLRELGEHMGFDFMLVAGADGSPLAGVARQTSPSQRRGQLVPLETSRLDLVNTGFLSLEGKTFQVASVPVDIDGTNIGRLSVGELFSLSDLTTRVALVQNGNVIDSNLPNVSSHDLEQALARCPAHSECDLRIRSTNWISLPMQTYPDGYTLLSLQNFDEASFPIQSRLHKLFFSLAIACVFVALLCSVGSSTSIVKPIAAVVEHLKKAVHTGKLNELELQSSSIVEIQELVEIYNQASVSVRVAGENLDAAYLQFVGSLANALDARDEYTAGHSQRVSQISSVIASAIQLPQNEIERIRIGALLHDIGKIGIADSVLQKPSALNDEEAAIVRQHPVIGRRILEGVEGFAPYLNAVELHHENWDGSGYPHGQKGEETHLHARIIHVADAYDAMTTNRSYRSGMSPETALSILVENAGIQFDPCIVAAFVYLSHKGFDPNSSNHPDPKLELEMVAG